MASVCDLQLSRNCDQIPYVSNVLLIAHKYPSYLEENIELTSQGFRN